MDQKDLEKTLGVKFKKDSLLQTSLTHRSYLNEHHDYPNPSNERLEFLGDAVLQFLTSEFLYKNYPDQPEGNLTNFRAAVVCTTSLAEESRRLGYGKHLLLSHGEEASGGSEREYILANTFEAVLGAIYMNSGISHCRTFLKKELFYKIEAIVDKESYKDNKSRFQELAQEKVGVTPVYKVLEEWGPDHAKHFRLGVYLEEKLVGQGEGISKQRAEQEAANNALDTWEEV
ncbi:MAG: ribonuclease III [bacterium]|nr:ribonuclease III [bacterium]